MRDLSHLDGYMDAQGGAFLAALASQATESIVEIGVFKGKSLAYLAEGAGDVPVFGVDPWDLPGGAPRAEHVRQANNLIAEQVLAEYPNVTLIKGFSVDVAGSWEGPAVSLLHIDGKHTYKAVRADYEAWRPHFADGAVVVFDDYDHPKYPGVRRAVHELGHPIVRGRFAVLT